MTTATDTAAAPALNSAEAGLSERQSNRIPAYKVFDATKNMPTEQMLAIRWLHGYYYDTALSLSEVGKLLGYDAGTISKVFANRYEGDMEKMTRAIERVRKLQEERASAQKAPYIETGLYKDIEECCQAALTYQKPVFIYGESQVGKSEALKHYAKEHNHGETTYVEMPVGASISHFLAALAKAVRMNNSERGDILQLNIMRCFGPNNLLIVDEMHRGVQGRSYGGSRLKSLEFIRALHDNTGCGVVLCGTNVFADAMADKAMGKFLNQFNRRCLLRRQLPALPTRKDLNLFAAHYELPPASGDAFTLMKEVVTDHGLGVWLTLLRAGARRAANAKRDLTWDDVIKANAVFEKLQEVQKSDMED
jgi:DNA transposition AAA+ family ATPase